MRPLPLPPIPVLLLGALAFPSAASAHRLDEYLQATIVAVEPGDVRLRINLTPGVEVAGQVVGLVDHDGDGVISPGESAAYAEALKRDLTVRLDGREAELKLAAVDAPPPAELRTGWGIIQVEYSAKPVALAAGAHKLTLENRHLPGVSAYLLNAAQPTSGVVRIIRQDRNDNQSVGEIEFAVDPPASSPSAGRVAACVALLLAAVLAPAWRARKNSPATT